MQCYFSGVKDYCERYGANIEVIAKEQARVPSWSGPTSDLIHEAMCKTMSVESLPERCALRDRRLAALAIHRNSEKEGK